MTVEPLEIFTPRISSATLSYPRHDWRGRVEAHRLIDDGAGKHELLGPTGDILGMARVNFRFNSGQDRWMLG